MQKLKVLSLEITTLMIISLLVSGCGILGSMKKPDIGPAGTPLETKENPPFTQRFMSPPEELSDLEATAGVIFEGIVKSNWTQAEIGLNTLSQLWPLTKTLIGDKKGVKDANAALEKLTIGISEKKSTDSYESLTKFMSSISDIGKSYKLSPLSDIIGVGNGIRTVNFYVATHDWHTATAKMKELDNTWSAAKPSLESIGILNKVTTTHSIVKQMKDAVEAEDKNSIEEEISKINESMGYIREYYRGK